MIECKSFSKAYGKIPVINKSDIQIRDRKISFIMGKNGSGKTTFIKCLMGLESYQGKIIIDGKQIEEVQQDCLVLWDDCPFYTNISGMDNLLVLGEGKKSKREIEKISMNYMSRELLNAKVKTYSYGQKKKLALTLSFLLEPKYLVMDEISNGLDYDTIKMLRKLIRDMSNDITVILTGHQFEFYNELVDDVYLIQDGNLVLYGEDIHEKDIKLEDIYNETMC